MTATGVWLAAGLAAALDLLGIRGVSAADRDSTPEAQLLLDLDLLREADLARDGNLLTRMGLLERMRLLESLPVLESQREPPPSAPAREVK